MGSLTCADLFCGAGGAAVGLQRAGFDVIHGFDIAPQPSYPFEFIQEDALLQDVSDYDFIWASPPCQAYSIGTRNHNKLKHPNLVSATRELLIKSGRPYIIENVERAPLRESIKLCGTMFPELKVFRHRIFESNIPLFVDMYCAHNGHKAIEYRAIGGDFYIVAGHMPGTFLEWSEAMGITHMKNKRELAEAIPPAYSEYLGKQVVEWLKIFQS